jgi:uncharacterized repeat protein (TIGR03803 family)
LKNKLHFLVVFLVVVAGRVFNANAQPETNLYSFVGYPADGNQPRTALVQGSDGNFYGTTVEGGTNNDGTIFRISPNGTYTNLYAFGNYPYDGVESFAGLVQGSDGNFYGTTPYGGTNNDGTIFRISPNGSYTNLYSFTGLRTSGSEPYAALVQGGDGNFYGTTFIGGTNNNGIVFRISPGGTYTNLYAFVGYPTDGGNPATGNALVQGSDGNFYGTTFIGGKNDDGTVFRISPSGIETNLYSFRSVPDGSEPYAGLVQGSDGNFYGTTLHGGTNNDGIIFRINPNGNETILYSFAGSSNYDGDTPYAGLVQGSDGNFYGTTLHGGTNNDGTIFRISPGGSYTNLYSYTGLSTGGSEPYAALVQGSDGNFYGTTLIGGTNDNGTVFKLTVPLGSPPYPINQITGIRLAVASIILTIPSIAGETYQLQYRNSLTSGSWSNVPGVSATNSIGGILTLTNFAATSQPQRFYRFAITQ